MPVGSPPSLLPVEQWQTLWRRHGGVRQLQELLLVWWDPFGVYGEPDAQDEYARYVPRLARMLRLGAREPVVAAHLRAVGVEDAGAAGEADLASRYIVAWHDRMIASFPHDRPTAAGRMPQRRTI